MPWKYKLYVLTYYRGRFIFFTSCWWNEDYHKRFYDCILYAAIVSLLYIFAIGISQLIASTQKENRL